MRIVAGQFKGRRLAGPEAPGLRPTSDSLRETLFNILGDSIVNARVLDGFAGTGAVGLEALSRGAAHVTFVERDRRAVAVIQENIRRCGAQNACAIVERDFTDRRTRRGESQAPETFDLVFLDPPYDVADLLGLVEIAAPRLRPAGRLVLEHSRRRESPTAAPPLQRKRVATAGDSALSFYQ